MRKQPNVKCEMQKAKASGSKVKLEAKMHDVSRRREKIKMRILKLPSL